MPQETCPSAVFWKLDIQGYNIMYVITKKIIKFDLGPPIPLHEHFLSQVRETISVDSPSASATSKKREKVPVSTRGRGRGKKRAFFELIA